MNKTIYKDMEINDFIKNFAEQFDETEPNVFTAETAFRELEEWDSFLALAVMAMIKSEYDINLTAEEMRNANTVQDLFNSVKSHL